MSAVLAAWWELIVSGELFGELVPSILRMFGGYFIGVALGVVLGLLMGYFRFFYSLLEPITEVLRADPEPRLPSDCDILFLGIDDEMKVFMIAFASLFPVLLNTYSGVRSVDPIQLQTARTFGVTGWKLLWQIVLPSAAPYIFTGMRVSLAVALIVMVISEMVAAFERHRIFHPERAARLQDPATCSPACSRWRWSATCSIACLSQSKTGCWPGTTATRSNSATDGDYPLSPRHERRHERIARPVDRRHMRGREVRRKQQCAFLGTIVQHATAGGARLVGKLAKPRVPMRRIDLQRMVHDIAAEQRTFVRLGKLQDDMADSVPGRRLDQQRIVDRMAARRSVPPGRSRSPAARAIAVGVAALWVGVGRAGCGAGRRTRSRRGKKILGVGKRRHPTPVAAASYSSRRDPSGGACTARCRWLPVCRPRGQALKERGVELMKARRSPAGPCGCRRKRRLER